LRGGLSWQNSPVMKPFLVFALLLVQSGSLRAQPEIWISIGQNLEDTADCKGHWIKASVESSGRFTVVNGRNGFSKTYMAR
jgi:hypothetical protein